MALVPYHSFRDIEQFLREEWPEIWEWPEKWLPSLPHTALMRTPRVDVYKEGGNIIAEIELPGVDPKNINLEVKDDRLQVEAKSEEKKEEKKKGYYKKELSRGYYQRIIPLPVEVQSKKATAVYKKGVLKVVMPEVKKATKKESGEKIKVKSE
ncbi:Hsp20/alpha crystallin family protein [bacterium]|nr:Hsp20/alpha crystallin family protein [bacterium]